MDNFETSKIYESNELKKQNSIWTKIIPRTNMVFMIISLLLVFGLDLLIIISSPSLRPFWYMMLAVMGVFLVFFFLENFFFSKKFANSKSALDPWISVIIVVRNLIFLLNFIPLIQLLGLMLLPYVFAPVCLVLYIILIICRLVVAKKSINTNVVA